MDYQLVHLAAQGFVGNCGIGLGQWDEAGSKFGVCARELDGKGGEDELKVVPILKVSGTEERSTESSVRERPFCDCLRDRGLSCSGQPVQPVDSGFVGVTCPELNFV